MGDCRKCLEIFSGKSIFSSFRSSWWPTSDFGSQISLQPWKIWIWNQGDSESWKLPLPWISYHEKNLFLLCMHQLVAIQCWKHGTTWNNESAWIRDSKARICKFFRAESKFYIEFFTWSHFHVGIIQNWSTICIRRTWNFSSWKVRVWFLTDQLTALCTCLRLTWAQMGAKHSPQFPEYATKSKILHRN